MADIVADFYNTHPYFNTNFFKGMDEDTINKILAYEKDLDAAIEYRKNNKASLKGDPKNYTEIGEDERFILLLGTAAQLSADPAYDTSKQLNSLNGNANFSVPSFPKLEDDIYHLKRHKSYTHKFTDFLAEQRVFSEINNDKTGLGANGKVKDTAFQHYPNGDLVLDKNGIPVAATDGYWCWRWAEEVSYPTHRFQLSLEYDKDKIEDTIKDLDAFAQKYHCYYKYPTLLNDWVKRIDSVDIYLDNTDIEGQKADLRKIAAKYGRRDDSIDRFFDGEKVATGVFYSKEVKGDDVEAVAKKVEPVNKDFANTITSNKMLSVGQLEAYNLIADSYINYVAARKNNTNINDNANVIVGNLDKGQGKPANTPPAPVPTKDPLDPFAGMTEEELEEALKKAEKHTYWAYGLTQSLYERQGKREEFLYSGRDDGLVTGKEVKLHAAATYTDKMADEKCGEPVDVFVAGQPKDFKVVQSEGNPYATGDGYGKRIEVHTGDIAENGTVDERARALEKAIAILENSYDSGVTSFELKQVTDEDVIFWGEAAAMLKGRLGKEITFTMQDDKRTVYESQIGHFRHLEEIQKGKVDGSPIIEITPPIDENDPAKEPKEKNATDEEIAEAYRMTFDGTERPVKDTYELVEHQTMDEYNAEKEAARQAAFDKAMAQKDRFYKDRDAAAEANAKRMEEISAKAEEEALQQRIAAREQERADREAKFAARTEEVVNYKLTYYDQINDRAAANAERMNAIENGEDDVSYDDVLPQKSNRVYDLPDPAEQDRLLKNLNKYKGEWLYGTLSGSFPVAVGTLVRNTTKDGLDILGELGLNHSEIGNLLALEDDAREVAIDNKGFDEQTALHIKDVTSILTKLNDVSAQSFNETTVLNAVEVLVKGVEGEVEPTLQKSVKKGDVTDLAAEALVTGLILPDEKEAKEFNAALRLLAQKKTAELAIKTNEGR